MQDMAINRRDFLRYSAILGIGLGLSRHQRVYMQGATPDAPPITQIDVTGKIKRVHDPAIIRHDNTYYLFSTGAGIPVRQSTNLVTWDFAFPPVVFSSLPAWVKEAIPGQVDAWAPDISYYNDKYHLYYSVS